MFETLLESGRRATLRRPHWNAGVALALHVAVLGVALRPTTPLEASRPVMVETAPYYFPVPTGKSVSDGPALRLEPVVTPATFPLPWPDTVVSQLAVALPTAGAPTGPVTGLSDPLSEEISVPVSLLLVQDLPELLAAPPPTYPPWLRDAGVEGRVVLQLVVDTLGRAEPGSVRVVRSDHTGFEAPAAQSLRRARFRPARVYGRAVRVLVQVPVEFRLRR